MPADAFTPPRPFGVTWTLSGRSGWGVFGWNLVRELLVRGGPPPFLLIQPDEPFLSPFQQDMLAPLIGQLGMLEHLRAQSPPGHRFRVRDALVLHGLGNGLQGNAVTETTTGEVDAGFAFFEDPDLDSEAVERGQRFARLIAGSTWNAELLRAVGFEDVRLVIQGVDVRTFFPRPRARRFGDRFVVYSGGKAEVRKGQDLVLAAFARFHARHPDSLLVAAWHNPWPETALDLGESPHLKTGPMIGQDGMLDIAGWAAANGVGSDAFVDLGWVGHGDLADVLASVDAAIFPNRCEGGTNLVAMEAMACGVPSLISDNTGHQDLIAAGAGIALKNQTEVPFASISREWRETDVDEMVEALDILYTDRSAAGEAGQRAAAAMAEWSWERRISELLQVLGDLL